MRVLMTVLLGISTTLAACGTTTPPLPVGGTDTGKAEGGNANAEATRTGIAGQVILGQPGSTAEGHNANVSNEEQRNDAQAGDAIVGVAFGGGLTGPQMLATDPVITSLAARINAETEKDEPDDALLATLYDRMIAQTKLVMDLASAARPDFSKLTNLNVMVLVAKANGGIEREVGGAQAEALSKAMRHAVAYTMGKEPVEFVHVPVPESDLTDLDGNPID